MGKEARFEEIHKEGNGLTRATVTIIVDTETGVNYMFAHEGYAGGLTPLLDAEGKPIITR